MTNDALRQRRLLEAQVERWTSAAKKLTEQGKDAAALELYRRAADELSGAPWLQHRTAELARKLKQNDVAMVYFRRAATAFQLADFAKRAVAPLRTAWTLAAEGLPASAQALVDVAQDLIQLHRKLGFAADAAVTWERTNAILRAKGFSELPPAQLEPRARGLSPSAPPSSPPASRAQPFSSVPPHSQTLSAPEPRPSDVQPSQPPSSRARSLARLLGRRG